MTAATALASGNDASPRLVEQAVDEALQRAGGAHANSVLLFLTPEFARHAQTAVLAAARVARCTQVFGGIAAGLCTEAGWTLDRPAAAAMVLGGNVSLTPADTAAAEPLLCFAGSPFPSEWAHSRRFGMLFHGSGSGADGAVWQMGRVIAQGNGEAGIRGASARVTLSTGLRRIGPPLTVERLRGYDLEMLGGQPALDSLLRHLPADWRERLPLHQINVVVDDPRAVDGTQVAAIISANADRSLTLTMPLRPGQTLHWAIRQPLAAEADMREALSQAAAGTPPDFALFFSCIGRGPYFYGGEDRDLLALRECYPGLPLIGAYGTGQIAFHGDNSRQLQNAVVTAFFHNHDSCEADHVQPQP